MKYTVDMKLKSGDKSCGLNAHIAGIYGGATARRRRASGAPYLGKFVTHQSEKIWLSRDCPYLRPSERQLPLFM